MANEGKAMDAALDYIIKQDQALADYAAFIEITEMNREASKPAHAATK